MAPSQPTHSLLDHFRALKDPRERWRVQYPLDEILLVVPCATLGGMEDFVEVRLQPGTPLAAGTVDMGLSFDGLGVEEVDFGGLELGFRSSPDRWPVGVLTTSAGIDEDADLSAGFSWRGDF